MARKPKAAPLAAADTAPDADQAREHATLIDDLRALIAEAKLAFSSEIAFQSARAGLAGKIIGRIAGLAALALALGPVLSPWGALGVVVLGLLTATGLVALGVLAAVRRLKRVLGLGSAPE